MTTNEQGKPRSIDELSRLDTFQGMTDEEIQRLMDYRAKIAAERADSEARQREQAETLKTLQDEAAKTREQAQASFEAACAINPGFKSVVNDG